MQNKNYYLKKFAFSTYGYAPNWFGEASLGKSNAEIATEERNKKLKNYVPIFKEGEQAKDYFRKGDWIGGIGRGLNEMFRSAQRDWSGFWGGKAGEEAFLRDYARQNPGITTYGQRETARVNKINSDAEAKQNKILEQDPEVMSGSKTLAEKKREGMRKVDALSKLRTVRSSDEVKKQIQAIQDQIANGEIKGEQELANAKKEIEELQASANPYTRAEQIHQDKVLRDNYGDIEANAKAVASGKATQEQMDNFENHLQQLEQTDPEQARVYRMMSRVGKPGGVSQAEAQMGVDNLNIQRRAADSRSAYEQEMAQYNNGMKQLNALREQVRNTENPEERKRLSQKAISWSLAAQRRKKEIDEKYTTNTADLTAGERAAIRRRQATREQVSKERQAAGKAAYGYNEAAIQHMKNLGYSDKAISRTMDGDGNDATALANQKALWETMDENTRKAVGWNFNQPIAKQPTQQPAKQPIQQPAQQPAQSTNTTSNAVNAISNFKPNTVNTDIKNPMSDVAKNNTQAATKKPQEKPKDNIITKAVRGGFNKYTL